MDVVLVSHDHYDHLGEATIRGWRGWSRWRGAVGDFAGSGGVAAAVWGGWGEDRRVGLDGECVGRGALEMTAVPARHFSGRGMLNRFETLWSSFVLKRAGA